MKEDSELGGVVCITIDGETIPLTDGGEVDTSQIAPDPITSGLADIPKAIEIAIKVIGEGWSRLRKWASRVIDDFLIWLGGMIRPKWRQYYQHGRSGKTRRKYAKKLKRAGWEMLNAIR